MKRKGISLKWSLIALICVCYILPIVCVLLISNATIKRNLERQVKDMVNVSVENTVQLAQGRLNQVLDASKRLSYDTTVRSAYLQYRRDQDAVALYDTISTFMTKEFRYDEHFHSSYLIFTDNPDPTQVYYVLGRQDLGSHSKVQEYRAQAHEKALALSREISTEISFFQTDYGTYMVRNIVDPTYQVYAVIVNELNWDAIFKNMRDVIWLQACSVSINGLEGGLSGIPPTPLHGTIPAYDKETGLYRVRVTRRLTSTHTIHYSIVSDGTQLFEQMPTYTTTAIIILMLSTLLLGLIISMFYKHISKPVNNLVEASERVEAGEMGFVLQEMPTNREFWYLTEHFNSMSLRLKEQFERIYKEQSALQDSRIKALQSQINPHFLNNTLEIINWEARMANNEKVAQMIEALSTMLNAAMDRDDRPSIRLYDELTYVDSYLYIISMRYGKRLCVEKHIDDRLLNQQVPRLIMQPIVENAVEHGISSRRDGKLVLRIYREGARLLLEVENNNPLGEQDKATIDRLLCWDSAEQPETGAGRIGIRNVNMRIQMLHGPGYGLTVEKSTLGTLARMVLPYVEEQE